MDNSAQVQGSVGRSGNILTLVVKKQYCIVILTESVCFDSSTSRIYSFTPYLQTLMLAMYLTSILILARISFYPIILIND